MRRKLPQFVIVMDLQESRPFLLCFCFTSGYGKHTCQCSLGSPFICVCAQSCRICFLFTFVCIWVSMGVVGLQHSMYIMYT